MLLFITLAAMIAVTVTLMLTQLFTSISSMYETANPPHFLQMHKGEFSQADIDEFNRGYEGIRHCCHSPCLPALCGAGGAYRRYAGNRDNEGNGDFKKRHYRLVSWKNQNPYGGRLCFVLCATSGEISFDGQKTPQLSEKEMEILRLKRMGFIFRKANFLKNLSVADNIVFPAFQLEEISRNDIRKTAEELMKRLGILSVAGHDIRQVSGGQLQRAAVCRAMISRPDILFHSLISFCFPDDFFQYRNIV